MEIKEDIADRITEYYERLRSLHPRSLTIKDPEELANKILEKHLNKKEALKEQNNDNNGIEWAIFKRQNINTVWFQGKGRCAYCTRRLTRCTATVDHKLSPLRGGKNTIENVCLSCGWCNVDKGILTPDEYQYKQLHNAAQGIYPE